MEVAEVFVLQRRRATADTIGLDVLAARREIGATEVRHVSRLGGLQVEGAGWIDESASRLLLVRVGMFRAQLGVSAAEQ
jgi:hypothetical protein